MSEDKQTQAPDLVSSDYEKGFEAGCAFTIAALEESLWHLNYIFNGTECCKRCALVRPAEGWTRPCKGPHELSLREKSSEEAAMPDTRARVDGVAAGALDEIETALISIADGVSPQIAAGQAFNVINRERVKLNNAASTVEQSDELAGTTVDENAVDARLDRAWIAGAKYGWNCAVADAKERFNAAIKGRYDDIHAAATAPIAELKGESS